VDSHVITGDSSSDNHYIKVNQHIGILRGLNPLLTVRIVALRRQLVQVRGAGAGLGAGKSGREGGGVGMEEPCRGLGGGADNGGQLAHTPWSTHHLGQGASWRRKVKMKG
jgi:hypothetical protein